MKIEINSNNISLLHNYGYMIMYDQGIDYFYPSYDFLNPFVIDQNSCPELLWWDMMGEKCHVYKK